MKERNLNFRSVAASVNQSQKHLCKYIGTVSFDLKIVLMFGYRVWGLEGLIMFGIMQVSSLDSPFEWRIGNKYSAE